jgi:FkbM family methyltransferase
VAKPGYTIAAIQRSKIVKEALVGFILEHPRLHATARTMKRECRHTLERLGSDLYSHPALDDLDRKLAPYVSERNGTFVEAGAYDGYSCSNTYWFERFRGWSGVLIEPLPELADIARSERPRSRVFQCALVPPEYQRELVTLHYGGIMSVLAGVWNGEEEAHARTGAHVERRETYTVEVPACTLSAVLDEASISEIDLMTLDVEGFEAPVLRGLDLSRHAPRFLLVEMLREKEERGKIEAILGASYRHEAQLSWRDHLYRRLSERTN